MLLTPAVQAAQDISERTRDGAVHVMLHELAHALILQFELPVLGDEEAAADNFAAIMPHILELEAADRIALNTAGSGSLGNALTQSGALEDMATVFQLFQWPENDGRPEITLAVETCSGGAYWFDQARRLVFCEEYLMYIDSFDGAPDTLAEVLQ